MLLRLLLGRVRVADVDVVRERLLRRIESGRVGARGLIGVRTGFRVSDGTAQLLLASIWESHDALEAGVRAEYSLPKLEQPFSTLLEPPRIETHELVTEVVRSVALIETGVLRFHRMTVPGEREHEFSAFARRRAEALLERPEITDVYLGRRMLAPARLGLVLLIGWRDAASFRAYELSDERAASVAGARRLVEEHTVETYEELGYRVPVHFDDAPALLVLDDDGRVVDATARAAALLGRDPWDVVGLGIADLVPEHRRSNVGDGWQRFLAAREARGQYAVVRGSGGEMLVNYMGRVDAPVPGRHTVLLVARDEAEPDAAAYDAAIAGAFPVARVPEPDG